KPEHSYNMRVNRQDVLSACEFGGNYSFRIPAHNQICAEFMLEMNLPALTGGATYTAYPFLNLIKRVTLRTGNKVFEYEPAKIFPLLLSKVRDDKMKAQLMELFEDHSGGTASATGGRYIMPLLQPWSIWFTDRIAQPIRLGNRGGALFDCSRLSDNMVVEIQLNDKANATSAADAAFASASNLGNFGLRWEEVVASGPTLAAIRQKIPRSVCIEEYTRLERQDISDATTTVYKVASLVSRAGTSGFYFKVDDGSSDCMTGQEQLKSIVVRCDGRDIYSTDGRADDQRLYQSILAGRPGAQEKPQWAHWRFGNDHECHDPAKFGSLLRNGACNELDLELQAETGGTKVDIIACHPRVFVVQDGVIQVQNAY
ncbi:MAG: hypothetical protein VYC03_06945, partial [Pseudomonadota bacterium]|nr:hypothetical protein [Pseudomonadota bacterium]